MDIQQCIAINRAGWDRLAAEFHGTALPQYGPLAQSETELHLIEPIQRARILEIGCGSGQSLLYLAQQGADELWGLESDRSSSGRFAGTHCRPEEEGSEL